MRSKIKKLVQYGIPVAIIILILIGYSESRSDYKSAGMDCNLEALKWTQEMDKIESLYFYEKFYVSCMRSNGYLLEGFDYTIDTIR